MKDLYEVLTDVIAEHSQADEYGYDIEECRCGARFNGTYAEHVGQVIGDLLIDLAGRGKLLASINQIARGGRS